MAIVTAQTRPASRVSAQRRLRVLTWNVHGNYLYYLSQVQHDIFLVRSPEMGSGYGGRGTSFDFGESVRDIDAADIRFTDFDCIIFQSRRHYLEDQERLFSVAQRHIPRIYIEHDPPQEHPTNARHWVRDPAVTVVHVTPFNALMWDNGGQPVEVIEHGVLVPPVARYTGELERGVVVVNNLASRGRRLGADVFERLRAELPLDLVGMGSESLGGLGEVPPMELPGFISRYRFFLNPIRYTSLGLAVCEAMTVGLPILGLATTEMVTVVQNGVSGYLATDPAQLVAPARHLLSHPGEAATMGSSARATAIKRFGISRFVAEWERLLARVTGNVTALPTPRGVPA